MNDRGAMHALRVDAALRADPASLEWISIGGCDGGYGQELGR